MLQQCSLSNNSSYTLLCFPMPPLNGHWASVIWRPDASDGVVDRLHWLGLGSKLLSVGVSQ